MANSKLLKEAIADAKAVKETALANAKIALEEAFTPRLQSILSQKLRAEAEEEENKDAVQEELDSSDIGASDGKEPSGFDAHTDLQGVKSASGEPGSELDDYSKVKDLNEEEDSMEGDKEAEIAELKARLAELEGEEDENDMSDEFSMGNDLEDDGEDYEVTGDEEEEDEDDEDLDLEAIIRELESQLGEEESSDKEDEPMYEEEEAEKKEKANENLADGSEAGTDKGEDPKVVVTNEEEEKEDDVIDLEEILREMEDELNGDKKKVDEEEEKELEKDLKEAYKTIKSLQKTINEVNLLNAKLLFANKLFRAHNMTNEQKVKVIETLDRTKSVREVKLVFSTLAENFKYSANKVAKKSITEGIASKVVKSTKPAAAAQKQVIAESADFSNRFKKLAGIIK